MCVSVALLSRPAQAQTGQRLQGFNLEGYTDSGAKSWDVKGDRADFKGSNIEISNVDANSYGQYDANLKARKGVVNRSSGNVHLEDHVVVTTKEGARLTTDSLDWHKSKDLVTTDQPVRITDKQMVATGQGLKAHPQLDTAQLNKDVKVTMENRSDKKTGKSSVLTVTCNGPMEIDRKKNEAVFRDNVVAAYEGRTLQADRMEVYFDGTTQKVSRIICTGHVVIVQGPNRTYSEKAVYNAADEKIILSGRPKLILVTQGNNALGLPEGVNKKKKTKAPAPAP